jgi:hypothetical protein
MTAADQTVQRKKSACHEAVHICLIGADAGQAPIARVLGLEEQLGVCTDRFCRIGRAKPRNPAGIFAHTNHQPHRPRFHTAWTQSWLADDRYGLIVKVLTPPRSRKAAVILI